MMLNLVTSFGRKTVFEPRRAARTLLGMAVGNEALWTGFVLAAVLNALMVGLFGQIVVLPPEFEGLFPSPIFAAFASAFQSGGLMLAFTYVGRFLGGAGRLPDVALLMIWLSVLGSLVQIAAFVLLLVLPFLGGLVLLATVVASFVILLNFIAEAHGFDSLFAALGTVVLGTVLFLGVMTVVEMLLI